ncbi:MAG: CbiX/SirB N-terminal domain-containing protein [Bryobacterales bacterium]|nr:CbiX/SirB N-terminal domain-containing protein [Bryobacterales bacterium]MDE0628246.1 CbiX/SirB N-terminal domain-containing protein [Bryobacterales bacterium]
MTGDGIGLVVFAHGSRVVAANEAVRVVALEAARQAGMAAHRTAFLELAEPTLSQAVADLAKEGVQRVVVTPYFLTMGRHLVEDLPRLLEAARAEHPDLTVEASPPLDGHPDLAGILADRARDMLTRMRSANDPYAGVVSAASADG